MKTAKSKAKDKSYLFTQCMLIFMRECCMALVVVHHMFVSCTIDGA